MSPVPSELTRTSALRFAPRDRFMRLVRVDENGCWIWQGSPTTHGYGRFGVRGRRYLAHVWIYTQVRGAVPSNKELDHLCRVQMCVNPDHLEAVTHLVNSRRGSKTTATVCAKGHPMTDANTYIRPSGRRYCRTCHRDRERGRR